MTKREQRLADEIAKELDAPERYYLGHCLAGGIEEDTTSDPKRMVLDYEREHIIDELKQMGYKYDIEAPFREQG